MRRFIDSELGEIIVHVRRDAKSIRIRLGTDGRYTATVPAYTPLLMVKRVVTTSRDELRQMVAQTQNRTMYHDGHAIGKRHQLAVITTQMVNQPELQIIRGRLVLKLPPSHMLESPAVQQQIRDYVVKILRREAKAYLPERLAMIAKKHGFRYERVRFSHATSRWGSCSSTGTISLNIALMKLPDELIDYVLIHELSHTKHMNHSAAFWHEVSRHDPLYKRHREQLKRETPTV